MVAWSNHTQKIVYMTQWQGFLLLWDWLAALGFLIIGAIMGDKNWRRTKAAGHGQNIALKKSKYFW